MQAPGNRRLVNTRRPSLNMHIEDGRSPKLPIVKMSACV